MDSIAQVTAQTRAENATPGTHAQVVAHQNESVSGPDRAPESIDSNLAKAKPDYQVSPNCLGPGAPLMLLWNSPMAP